MRAVILSNKDQYEQWAGSVACPETDSVYCDNTGFYEFLRERRIPFKTLDEFLLRDHWSEINTWGCTKANEWIVLCEQKKIFSGANLVSVIRLLFSHILVQSLKNRMFAQRVYKDLNPQEVFIFEPDSIANYPSIAGNYYLNYFLKEIAGEKGLKIVTQRMCQDASINAGRSYLAAWKVVIKYFLENTLKYAERIQSIKRESYDVVAYGSLNHLGSLLAELNRRGKRIAIYDFELHKDIYTFAKKNRCAYLTSSMFLRDNITQDVAPECYLREMTAAFEAAIEHHLFCFEGYDFGDFLRLKILPSLKPYLEKIAQEKRICDELLKKNASRIFLVDEDFGLKGSFFSAYLGFKGAGVFCISHANYPVNYEVPEANRIFSQSSTFVQSEYEKAMYAIRGWDTGKIIVTGLPRYDTIGKNHYHRPDAEVRNRKMKILYAAAAPSLHSPNQLGYMGEHFFCSGNIARTALKKIFEAASELPLEILIKPHDADLALPWRKIVDEMAKEGVETRVLKGTEDFLALLHQSDALILSYTSTAILEAAISQVPVFFVMDKHYEGFPIDDYVQNGYCHFFSDIKKLRDEFRILCDIGREEYMRRHPYRKADFYLGKIDGESSRKITDIIVKKIFL